MSTNDTLIDQCRREAEELYPMPSCEQYPLLRDWQPVYRAWLGFTKGYAEALYAERSKPRTSLSVEEVMAIVAKWDRDTLYDQDRLKASIALRASLTAKLNEPNTQTNG